MEVKKVIEWIKEYDWVVLSTIFIITLILLQHI
jgi:hypothetical protein